ncbi:MFS transporter [Mycobacterium shinjukuense]|uniref:MFS transporter n=1 Tax=Mycobacterium shinjukuense TaxID=398694 RepID=A0A7I7MK18_9MYCO|nr:MFS transporter [Mycobacterium shinjukuense]MCV6984455.1 MFS transporter [Mycobacterium shinjukuense]ORB65810.1 MFS transporter [Mycobacterium shinjukuense]BBX72160.1 MFS transporter [Mycobacterium shinjukuense]
MPFQEIPPPRYCGRDRAALQTVNFFMADMEAGMGPFLGVLLASRGWTTGAIGAVITLGAIVGMVAVGPAGALVDATHRKRACVIVVGLAAVAASAVILTSRQFWVVAGAQAVMCISGATIAPAVIGITLGVVGQAGFTAQNGRNQAYNHAGNMVGAAASGLLGWLFGYGGVFWLAVGFAVVTIVAVLAIPGARIDHHVARGEPPAGEVPVSAMRVLLRSRPLLALAAALVLFHLGNAAILPFYGLAVVATHANPFATVASTVVVAQAVMIVAALVAMRIAQTRGYWLAILIAFTVLPVRGLLAAAVITTWGVIPVQVLDGIGAGMLSVAVPGLVARILDGTGHINVGQGAIMAAQGLGGALSPLLGGVVAQHLGFPVAFAMLGAVSLGSLIIWLGLASLLRPPARAVAKRQDVHDSEAIV